MIDDLVCPECGSDHISNCPGGTCYKLSLDIKYICGECLNEW